jgi:hypothetical protein
MRWVAALAAGACTAVALFAAFYGLQGFFDWRAGRAELLARIAALESNPGAPNRDGNLAAARHLIELTNGVAVEKVGSSALALVVAVIALAAAWRYAARSLSRGRLVLTVTAGAVIPAVIAGIMVMLLGLGAIRG